MNFTSPSCGVASVASPVSTSTIHTERFVFERNSTARTFDPSGEKLTANVYIPSPNR